MAIFKAGVGYEKPIVAGGQMYTASAQGALQIVTSTTNRAVKAGSTAAKASVIANGSTRAEGGSASKAGNNTAMVSAGFQALDATIIDLDAAYDLLEDKSEWIEDAELMEGAWNLCASCQPDESGKKFFRQSNFYRIITHDVVTPDAPVIDSFDEPLGATFYLITVTVPPIIVMESNGLLPYEEWIVGQAGLGLNNPVWLLRNIDITEVDPNSVAGQFLLKLDVGQSTTACCCSADYVPRVNVQITRGPDV